METTLPRTETLTTEFLLQHFGDGANIDPTLTEKQAERTVAIANGDDDYSIDEMYNQPPSKELALFYLSDVLNFHGVERIRDHSYRHSYYGNTKYLYINSGDSYALELYYNVRSKEWIAGCFGDLYQEDEALQIE